MCSRTISVPIRYTSKCLTDSHAVEKPFPAENGKHDYIPYVNGGLFAGNSGVPHFSKIARTYLIHIGGQ